MTVAPTHDTLCAHHVQRAEAAEPDPEALAAELLENTGNLNTADRVNALLANTVKQFALQRIDRADALAFGYLAQMLLNTVPGVQKEHQAIRNAEARQALRKSIAESQARRSAVQPAGTGVSSRASSTGTPACAPVATTKSLTTFEADVSSRAILPQQVQRGIPPGSLSGTDHNLATPPSHTFAHQSDDAELSDEALLAVVLQATAPQPRR
jgi:hypothetical protein